MIHRIYTLQTIYHTLSFSRARQKHGINLSARGYLVGNMQESLLIDSEQQVVFTGQFNGFFQQNKDSQDGLSWYFQGRIQDFAIISINNDTKDHRIEQGFYNIFVGYFKGYIEERQVSISSSIISPLLNSFKHNIMKQLKEDYNILEIESKLVFILPTYARFQIKKVQSINLKKLIANVSGDIVISIQFSHQLLQLFYHPVNRNKKIILQLNKDNSIELPLIPGIYGEENNDVLCYIDKDTYEMRYTVRRTIKAFIDCTYGEFFTPFSLTYIKIIMNFHAIHIEYPYELQRNLFEKTRHISTHPRNHTRQIKIDFLNLELEDTLNDNPYTSLNELLDIPKESLRKRLFMNRISKISHSEKIESGQYMMATNYLTLFTHHSRTFKNSVQISDDSYWSLGISNKNCIIQDPIVKTIQQQFQNYRQILIQNPQTYVKLFHIHYWKYIHIQIPIYRYWVLHVFQIFVPIIILSSLSLFIFVQQNGTKQDGTSTLNARIINVSSVLLAYVALIPMIRSYAPLANKATFVYIVIYSSIAPHLLALISSIKDNNQMTNDQWKKHYKPFSDPPFLISFGLLILIICQIAIVVARFISASANDYQARVILKKIKFRKFKDAVLPKGVQNYLKSLVSKRKHQYLVHTTMSLKEEKHIHQVYI